LQHPISWDGLSQEHMVVRVIHDLMADLRSHQQILDASRLRLSVESWDRFKDGEMLDDDCVDHMIRCITSALGVYMPGCSPEDSYGGPSQLVHIPADHCGDQQCFTVLGVMNAQSIRLLIKP
jgi:hypothetical protein